VARSKTRRTALRTLASRFDEEDVRWLRVAMAKSNVDKMLINSLRPSTLSKNSRLWDKWLSFAALHCIDIMPPNMRSLEIFVFDIVKLSGSCGVANSAAAAVAHFCVLEGFPSPFVTPRLTKIMRGIRQSHGKASRPKLPFTREHIIEFLTAARRGTLLDWRVALPLALCFQQLLRGAECFELKGSNVTRYPGFFQVEVESAKDIPEGFGFKIMIDPSRPHCVGQFMADYLIKMGVKLGDKNSYFACKVLSVKGVLKAVPSAKLCSSSMRSACKRLIESVGLDGALYAMHSSKRGGALAAMEAGLSQVQIQDLGRWARASMVARYTTGDPVARSLMSDAIKI
jgi:hypothetical protein